MSHLVFIGAGAWASALACVAARSGHSVSLVSRSLERAHNLHINRRSPGMPEGFLLPETVLVTHDLDKAIRGASALFLVLPVQETLPFLEVNGSHIIKTDIPVITCSKGIDRQHFRTPAEILSSFVTRQRIAVLSGPNFASEIMLNLPAACVIAAEDPAVSHDLCTTLSCQRFRCYQSRDVTGVSLCGALKNIFAIAAGIIAGKGYGENARAALITRGLHELATYIDHAGGRRSTLYGLAGLGDILLTCSSSSSRNYAFGLRIGQHTPENISECLASETNLVEGVQTCHALATFATKSGLDLPITQGLSHLLHGNISIEALEAMLLTRPLAKEGPDGPSRQHLKK